MGRVFIILSAFAAAYLAFEIIPERPLVVYINDKYIKNLKYSVRRAGRQAKYVVNIDAIILHQWERNVTFLINFFEYRHNEYKPSFVNFPEMTYCDAINFILFRKTLAMMTCPMLPGELHLTNLTVFIEDFPYKWPFEKCKARLTIRVPKENILLYIGELFMSVKQTKSKKP